MEPRTAAAVLTLLLLVFSARHETPTLGSAEPPGDAAGVSVSDKAVVKTQLGVGESSPTSPTSEGTAPTSEGLVGGKAAAPAPGLEPVPRLESGTSTTVTERARVRKGPGTSYPTLAIVNPPAKLVALTRHGDWYQVRLQDGRIGWIAGFLVVDPTSGTEGGWGSGAAPKRAPGEIDDPGKGTPADRWVLGYYTEDYPGDPTSHGSLARGQQVLDSMAAFLHPVDASGRVSGKASRRAMETSRSTGIRALALVHNLTASGFDAKRAHALLQTANSRAQAAADILDILEEGGYDGVNIDLENVYAQDRSKLTAFMTELAEKLRPRGYLVTMSVPAKTADHAGAGWVGAFDYYALGRVCDRVMLMTYDEHSKTSGPGPIASYNWVEKVVRYATTQMPRAKILLGIPAYGYDWNLDTGRVVALPYTQVMNRAKNLGIDPSWDPEARSPHFKYVDSRGERHEIWFESSESIKPKLDLIDKYGLGGVAIWKLGYEDDAYWKAIREKLR